MPAASRTGATRPARRLAAAMWARARVTSPSTRARSAATRCRATISARPSGRVRSSKSSPLSSISGVISSGMCGSRGRSTSERMGRRVSGRSSRPGGRLGVGLREAPEEVRPAGGRPARDPSEGRPPLGLSPGLPERGRSDAGRSLRGRSDADDHCGAGPTRTIAAGLPTRTGLVVARLLAGLRRTRLVVARLLAGLRRTRLVVARLARRGLPPGLPTRLVARLARARLVARLARARLPGPAAAGSTALAGFRDPEPCRLSLLGRSDVTLDPLRQVLGK